VLDINATLAKVESGLLEAMTRWEELETIASE
jgi:hypothetical protein